jgi:oligopeptide transport system ATP-binding protein
MFANNLNKNNYVTSKEHKLTDNNILEVKNLEVSFRNKLGLVRAVRGVDFSIRKGQIVGLVGESGSGKSVSVKAIIGFNDDAIIDADSINLNGIDILSLKKSQ